MPEIQLGYGNSVLTLEYDPERFEVLRGPSTVQPLTDAEIGERLDNPIFGSGLADAVKPGGSVLIVVPDATRRAGCPQIVNLLVRRLIESGTSPGNINIIFATGIHRPVTRAEKSEILTPFIAQRIKSLDHNPGDLAGIIRLGETSGGIPVELNRALVEHDHVILVGGISFHYFAGFTGGRKLVCPGLASKRTVAATHKLAFDCEKLDRRERVGPGLLEGNAVHEAFVEAAKIVNISFAVNTIVNEKGEAAEVFCGDWIESHQAACNRFSELHTSHIKEKRDVVIASCGGYPHDINMIQAHKALQTAASACKRGGTIILLAECREGPGRADFLDWFDAENSNAMAARLCENYKVNGQTAWSLLRLAEDYRILILTALNGETTSAMRLRKVDTLNTALDEIPIKARGFILPAAPRIAIACGD